MVRFWPFKKSELTVDDIIHLYMNAELKQLVVELRGFTESHATLGDVEESRGTEASLITFTPDAINSIADRIQEVIDRMGPILGGITWLKKK